MFAIALWDRQSRSLSLVRDRLGKKPLYYGSIGGTFFFGSQPKSFFPHPSWRAEIDRDSLTAFMRFGYVPAPRSIFKGLASVRPGEWVEVRGGEVVARRLYWDARAKAAAALAEPMDLSDEEAVARFEALLSGAVARRLLSDVPLGAFLSGGVDSSAVVALMQANGTARAKTFSIGFNESAYDESRHARAVAEHLGTDHHELRVSPREAIEAIPAMPLYYDEPFADGSQVPTYLLSKLTREHVTVALSGDGGDELLAGYTRYRTGKDIARVIRAIPAALRPAVAGAIRGAPDAAWRVLEPFVPRRLGQSPLSSRMRRFGGYMSDGGEEAMFRGLVGQWAEPEELVRGGREPVDDIWQGALAAGVPDFGRRMQLIDTLTYLPDDILVKVDRASMGAGLEARAPLLDHAVVEFTWGLPDRFLDARRRDQVAVAAGALPPRPQGADRATRRWASSCRWTSGCGARSGLGGGPAGRQVDGGRRPARSRARAAVVGRAPERADRRPIPPVVRADVPGLEAPLAGAGHSSGARAGLSAGAQRPRRILDDGGEHVAQQIAHGHDLVGAALDVSRLEQAARRQRRTELRKVAVEAPVPPRRHLVHGAVPVAAGVDHARLRRPHIDVLGDGLLGEMDGGDGLQADADHQDERLVVAHQAVGAVLGHRRVVDLVAREQRVDGRGPGPPPNGSGGCCGAWRSACGTPRSARPCARPCRSRPRPACRA